MNASAIPGIDAEIIVDAKRSEAWRLWTTNVGIRAFFAPDSNVELRIGGPFEIYFLPDAPEGEKGSEGCRILSYSPETMLSFSWNAPTHMPTAREHHTWVVITFEEIAEQQTRVRLQHLGFAELAERFPEHAGEFKEAREYFNRAWPYVLGSMKDYYTGIQDRE